MVDFTADTGATTAFEYTGPVETRPSSSTNPQGNTLLYSWVNEQQLEKIQDGDDDSVLAEMTYRTSSQTCSGELASSTDGNGNTTTYSYTSACNLSTINRPGPAGNLNMTYDARDRLRTMTDGDGRRQTFTYDDNDRMTQVVYTQVGSSIPLNRVTYTYDDNGNTLTRVDTADGITKTTSYALDSRNRLASETHPAATTGTYTNAYTYDPAGNMTTMTTPWGTTNYTYGNENDVTSITPPVGPAIEFDYYEHTYAGIKFPNNVSDNQHYDTSGRIKTIDQHRFVDTPGGGGYTQLARLVHDYTDPDTGGDTNSLFSINDPVFNIDWEYTYDSQGRISTSYAKAASATNPFEDNTYNYDGNSNRTNWSRFATTTSASYNAANQMTSTTTGSSTVNYTYDLEGNLTSGTDGTAITYDVRGNATSLKRANGPTLEAAYSGPTQVERTTSGGTHFTQSILGVTSSGSGSNIRHYVRTPDGRVIAQYSPNTVPNPSWIYYLTNHQGSIVGTTNASGNRGTSFQYGAYGESQTATGVGAGNVRWRYTGEWKDGSSASTTAYTKIGLRYLDTNHGRWTQPDPLIRATNPTQPAEAAPYNYAGCNPVNQTDPTGAMSDCVKNAAGVSGLLSAGGAGIKGALKGAIAGSVVPGLGTTAGAIGGFFKGVIIGSLEGVALGAIGGSIGC